MIKISKTTIMVISIVIIYLGFILTSNIEVFLETLKKIKLDSVVLAISFWSLANFIRIIRWYGFLKKIDSRISFKISSKYYLAGFAFIFSPARLGEIIKAKYMKRDYGISVSRTGTIIIIERFYELISIFVILIIGMIFMELNPIILLIPIIIFSVIISLFFNKKWLVVFSKKLSNYRIFEKFIPNIEETYSTTFRLLKFKQMVFGLLTSLSVIFFQTVAVFVLINGLNESIFFADLLIIFSAANIIAAVTMIPGGIGVFEGGFIVLLSNHLTYETSIAISFLIRIISVGIFSIIGIIFLNKISKSIN